MRYFDFMVTGNPGLDGPRFQAQGVWETLTTELLLREEFILRGLTVETLLHAFPLYQAPPPPVAPAPAQGPPSPPAPGAPAVPESPGEVQEVVDLPDTPDVVVISSGDEGHVEDEQGGDDYEEDDPEEDPGMDEMQAEPQVGQAEDLGEGQEEELMAEEDEHLSGAEQEDSDAESVASTSSFDSGEEPDDDSDPDYDPSRDR